jgi:transposase
LADYLEPNFGDIYDIDELTVQPWAEELRKAVIQFVATVDESLYACAMDRLGLKVEGGARSEEVQFVMSLWQPWEVAYAFHHAAVILQPSPEGLVTEKDHWAYDDERMDVALWLQERLTSEQLRLLAVEARYDSPGLYRDDPDVIADRLSACVTPAELLDAWRRVTTAPTASDLTDVEFELLIPYIPTKPSWNQERVLQRARRSINGWLYRHAENCTFSQIPRRYGKPNAIQQKEFLWRKTGLFERMLAGLRGKPEAVRLVEWLEAYPKSDEHVRRGRPIR